MSSEVLNMKTKDILTTSIKKLMKKKPLDKIPVSEIVNDCGVSRRTFYYHFEDVYDAIGYICENDLKRLIKDEKENESYSDKASRFFNYMIENKSSIVGIQKSSQSWRIRNMYFQITSNYIYEILKNDKFATNVNEHELKVLADCYSTSISAIMVEMVLNDIDAPADFLISLLDDTLVETYRYALKTISKKQK